MEFNLKISVKEINNTVVVYCNNQVLKSMPKDKRYKESDYIYEAIVEKLDIILDKDIEKARENINKETESECVKATKLYFKHIKGGLLNENNN